MNRRLREAADAAASTNVEAILRVAGTVAGSVEVQALLLSTVRNSLDTRTQKALLAAARPDSVKLLRAGLKLGEQEESLIILRDAAKKTQDPMGRGLLYLAARVTPDPITQKILLFGAPKGTNVHSKDQLIRTAKVVVKDSYTRSFLQAVVSDEDPATKSEVYDAVSYKLRTGKRTTGGGLSQRRQRSLRSRRYQ